MARDADREEDDDAPVGDDGDQELAGAIEDEDLEEVDLADDAADDSAGSQCPPAGLVRRDNTDGVDDSDDGDDVEEDDAEVEALLREVEHVNALGVDDVEPDPGDDFGLSDLLGDESDESDG